MPPTNWTSYGEIFTRRWVVDAILDAVGYAPDADLARLRLCEPSCGSGAFLGPVVERLIVSAKQHDVALDTLGGAIRAYDLLPNNVEASRRVCADLLLAAGVDDQAAARQAALWVNCADFLLGDLGEGGFDVVVGNPPYIRYDDLPPDIATSYRTTWQTMRGRGDIFVGFFERSLSMLNPDGRVGFICADRWMRNQYGAPLRAFVTDGFAVDHVWAMHDVDAFEAQVSAYPAITVMSRRKQGSVVVAETTAEFGPTAANSLLEWAQHGTSIDFSSKGAAAHRLPHWFSGSEMWPTGSPARLALIELLADRFDPLHDPRTGTKVSIGVASGADSVYVTKDTDAVESDRLLPLAMRRDLMRGHFEWQGNYLVNPWDDEGQLVSLSDYPRMAAYLSKHPALKHRHVAKRAPSSWHRTIDKVTPGLVGKRKLLLQDMKAHIHPVLEPGGHYPHHNLYYVTSETWDMEVLGGLLLSRVAQAFIEAYCVRMRGGTLRFQSQYLKKIRVPNPETLDPRIADELRQAFRNRDVQAATLAAARAFAIDPTEYELTEEDDEA